MTKTSLRRGLTAACAAAALSFALSGTAASATETLNIQSSFNAGDFTVQYLTEHWLPKVPQVTGGRYAITLKPNGSVVPAKETIDATASGVLDGDFTSVNYFSGLEPAFAIMADLISGYDTPEQMLGFCKTDQGEAMEQKIVDTVAHGDVQVVGCGPYSRESLPARVPINGFADMKGKKIRAPEGLASAVFAAAGASPVSIPFSEVYGALEKGIVDAADASAYINNATTGLHDVASYPLYPGIHSMPLMQFTLSKDRWSKMSAADRAALRDWWYAAMEDLIKVVDEQDRARVASDRAAGKIHIINWAQNDRDRMRGVARGEWLKYADKSPLAREALNAHIAYMKKIGLFKD